MDHRGGEDMRGTIRGRALLTALLAVSTVGGVTAIASTAATASTATATPAGWPRGEASASERSFERSGEPRRAPERTGGARPTQPDVR
ncbi:MAG TPA: hypothetical protein VI365_21920, partial [Trebonia sp.]